MRELRSALLPLVLLLCSCAAVPPHPPGDAEALRAEREARAQAMEQWSFNGRAAVRGEGIDPRSVRLHWAADGDRHRLEFMSPLGQGVADLEFDARGATLRLPREAPRSARSAEALLDEALGWTPPVTSLVYWVRGLPRPGHERERDLHDAWGRLTLLEQDGWQVDFERWENEADGLALPRRLTLTHPRLRIRLLIDGWNPGA